MKGSSTSTHDSMQSIFKNLLYVLIIAVLSAYTLTKRLDEHEKAEIKGELSAIL